MGQINYDYYYTFSDRLYWDSWDPHNIAEAIFAVANVISFSRLSYILPAHELFGPMQISVAQMITVSIWCHIVHRSF